jgi:DNA polymerase-3 subunit delta
VFGGMGMNKLKKDLKDGSIRNLYIFYGSEEYLKKYYMNAIEKSILSDELKSLNKIVFEGKVEIGKIVDACETFPVFSEKKLVIVKNSALFKPSKGGSKNSKNKNKNEGLVNFLQQIPEYVCLIFYEEEIDKRIKPVNVAKDRGLVVEFPYQKPAELVKWVIKVFKSYNKVIDPVTASQLVENSELGMNEILNEINKVVLYLGDSLKVTSQDIDRVCTRTVKGRIFDLTDAIATKNRSGALKLLGDMIVLKEPLPKIIYMISKQFRQILEMKLLVKNGLSVNEAASRMNLTPYAARKVSKQSERFSVDSLKSAIRKSLEIDIAVKTGMLNDRIAAELLILYGIEEKAGK